MKNFIEVCSGAGGLSKGFMMAGYKPLLLNEIEKNACKTLRKNHPDANIFEGCMTEIDVEKYAGKVDVLLGGMPCQSFSTIGKGAGLDDPRGKLMFKFRDLLEALQPKAFIIENVQGLMRHKKGETLKIILDELNRSEIYKISYEILNANDYGVAQKRLRLIIVGVRTGVPYEFPTPLIEKPVLRSVLMDVPPSLGRTYNKKITELIHLVPPGGCWRDIPIDLANEYLGKMKNTQGGKTGILRRLSYDEPCLTLLTTPAQKISERCHPSEDRPFTTREYARIQSFPDDYEFVGAVSVIYRQIGNAVPPLMGRALAESLLRVI